MERFTIVHRKVSTLDAKVFLGLNESEALKRATENDSSFRITSRARDGQPPIRYIGTRDVDLNRINLRLDVHGKVIDAHWG